MTIRTYQSFSGYISSEPRTDPTPDGTPRFYARAGQKQGRREPDGTYTRFPAEYLPIIAFGDAAEEATATLAKGDNFTAEGRIRPFSYEKDGKTIEGEEFEVWKIGRRRNEAERNRSAERTASNEMPARGREQRLAVPPEFAGSGPSRTSAPALGM